MLKKNNKKVLNVNDCSHKYVRANFNLSGRLLFYCTNCLEDLYINQHYIDHHIIDQICDAFDIFDKSASPFIWPSLFESQLKNTLNLKVAHD